MLQSVPSGITSDYQLHILHAAPMLCAAGHDVYASSVDTRVPQDICKLCDIFFDAVKYAGKQVTEIMRKDLILRYSRLLAKLLHLAPYITAVHRLPMFGNKYRTRLYPTILSVLQQLSTQSGNYKHLSCFSLAGYDCLALSRRFDRNKGQFADAYACSADGLDEKREPLVITVLGGPYKCCIF